MEEYSRREFESDNLEIDTYELIGDVNGVLTIEKESDVKCDISINDEKGFNLELTNILGVSQQKNDIDIVHKVYKIKHDIMNGNIISVSKLVIYEDGSGIIHIPQKMYIRLPEHICLNMRKAFKICWNR